MQTSVTATPQLCPLPSASCTTTEEATTSSTAETVTSETNTPSTVETTVDPATSKMET